MDRSVPLVLALALACASNPARDPPGDGTHSGGSASTDGGAPLGANGGASAGAAGATDAAGTSSGGSAAGAPSAGACGGASGGSAADASFEKECLAAATDDCELCLCSSCTEELRACSEIAGCPEIAACVRESGCAGIDCYCGTFDALSCAGGQSNGPCKSTILLAPGARVPTALNPSAGPASDAAVSIARCTQPGESCGSSCSASR